MDYTAIPIYILDRKLTENIEDGASPPNIFAKTQYEYDNYGTISASGAVQHDSAFSTTYKTRGNVTKSQVWRNTDGTWLPTTKIYDDAGNVLSTTDPLSHTTSLSYADSWSNTTCAPTGGNGAAYVTAVTNALNQISHFAYNSCSGTMASTTDPNSQPTTFSFDLMNRLAQTNYPDGGQISDCYSDTSGASCDATGQISLTRTDAIATGLNKIRTVFVDGIGNQIQTQFTSDPDGTDFVDTTYDGLERKVAASNPHRSAASSTDGTTQYTYNALNRVTLVTQPDGSPVSTSYAGNQMTVTDEAGKKRKSQTDGLGRLTTVWEDPTTLNYETDYTYDVLNNLLTVNQKGNDPNSANWRTRTFTYDSLSRLLCGSNPEIAAVICPASGTFPFGAVTYTYDADGNALTKTAPAPNQASNGTNTETVTYSYDALNRLTQKSFSAITPLATPAIQYGYDGVAPTGCTPPALTDSYPKGRRTSMCDASGSTSWKHDVLGRILSESRTIAGNNKLTSYTYNLDGSLATLTYPTDLVMTYAYSTAGRALAVKDLAHSNNYANNALYTPAGALTSMQQNKSGSNILTTTDSYNSRQQPAILSASAPSATIMNLSYDFHASTHADNGNVFQIVNNKNNNHTQNFTYDALNRIASAYTQGTNWGETFTVDAWGNLTNKAPVTGKTNYEPLSVSATTQNHLTGFNYDPAGNMTMNGSAAYYYDAENHMTSASGGYSYIYDGDGNRVEKCTAGTTAGTCAASPTGTLYWMDTGGNNISETSLTGAMQSEYAFFGKRVGRHDANGSLFFYFSDHLGSTNIVANSMGVIQSESDFYPYGGEIVINGTPGFVNNGKIGRRG